MSSITAAAISLLLLQAIITAVDAGMILQNGNGKATEDFDSAIDRIFDLNKKVQDAWAESTQVVGDEIERADEGGESQTFPAPKLFMSPQRAAPSSKVPIPVTPAQVRVAAKVVKVPDPPKPQAPGDDLTGVPFGLLSICATISNQIYAAKEQTDFDLTSPNDESITADAIMLENHGALKDVIPPFCVAVADKCLIIAWRGSSTIMDWVSDFGAAPVSSTRWNKVASSVRAHSAYTSFVESDLAAYESFLLTEINTRKIDTVVLTGHSLGGGMAQVAHLMLEGQLQTSGSPWNQHKKSLTVKSVSFAAPMTTLVDIPADSPLDDPTRNFLTKIATHSCNLVYGPDIVPHGPGDIDYALDVTETLVPGAIATLPYHWVLRMFGIQRWANAAFEKMSSKESVNALIKTLRHYKHIGNVIYYPAGKSSPVSLQDCPEVSPESLSTFRKNPTVVQPPTVNGRNQVPIPKQLEFAHSFLLRSFAYNLNPPSASKV